MGNLRMASLLVEAGASVDAKSVAGRTSLHFAVAHIHLDMIQFLIERGADVNAPDEDGTSPLDDAVWNGNLEATAILLARGAHLNEAETKTAATSINEAAYRGGTQIVRYLLRFGPDLRIPDKRGYTPLENSIRVGNADSALLLLEAAPSGQKTPEFLNALLAAAIKKDLPTVVEAILQRGGHTNQFLASGATPLDAAVSQGSVSVVRVLLSAGADPNGASRDGASPLEDACLRGYFPIAELLLDKGALVNQVNDGSGKTALYAAASFGKSDVVTLLLQRGADPSICGTHHGSPYNTAVENGFRDIALQIERHGGSRACKQQQADVK
jgi:ankyrin repeat protein